MTEISSQNSSKNKFENYLNYCVLLPKYLKYFDQNVIILVPTEITEFGEYRTGI
jgi:hypothetical protein